MADPLLIVSGEHEIVLLTGALRGAAGAADRVIGALRCAAGAATIQPLRA